MSKDAVTDWSTTANDNTDVGGIDLGEGTMLVAAVNGALREIMKQVAAGIDGGSFVAFPLSVASASSAAYADFAEDTDNGSHRVRLIAPASLTGDITVTLPSSTGTVALTTGGTTTAAGILEIATSAEWRTGTDTARGLGVAETWGAAAEVTLTDAATIAVDMATFVNAKVTLGGNRTLGQPNNTKVGQCGFIRIIQDGTGTRTLAYHADWKFAGGVDPILTTTASATDLLFYEVIAANFIYATLAKGVA